MGVDVGDSLYLIEEYVGTTRCLVLSKTPRIPDRVDELVDHWERELAEEQTESAPPESPKDE
ncbi:hypothetical protein [Geopseudomonas aromaticivorans]